MGILADNNVFVLQSKNSTYIIKVLKDKYLAHMYYGKKISEVNGDEMSIEAGRVSFHSQSMEDWWTSLDTLPMEYPSFGNTDLRHPAYQIQVENGSRITDLSYESYKIVKDKPVLSGLPHVYDEDGVSDTLVITLMDSLIGLKVELYYTVFENMDVITRSTKFFNMGEEVLKLQRALSMSMDFSHHNYDLITLSGSWARERHMVRRGLNYGMQGVESRRGASGHAENPFAALVSKDCNEHHGEAYGFSLVYSGNFAINAEVEQYHTTRISVGINPFDFEWRLEQEESFQTPEVILVYSDEGMGGMSRTYHKLFNNYLVRGKYKNAERPVLINNWEATYFNFTEDKLLDLSKVAGELDIELLVLDDGWFGKRNHDNSSLGDWFVNEEKLPNGLPSLVEKVNGNGIGFGLWVEPEMVSPNSNLYRNHPDWCIHVPDRYRSQARKQLILDYSRKDVRDYIVDTLSQVFTSCNITYVKWDMNRNLTEIGSELLESNRQKETSHRHILGVYEVMEVLTSKYPNILFESCSGGGGRFDPGILYYMPQAWTSDDTDGVERLKIQYGTSLVYPISSMTAHVSAAPNHQTGRNTSLQFRGDVAMAGNFGYELDITQMEESELDEVRNQVKYYKEIRNLVQYGEQYRILSPFDGNMTAWMNISEDKKEAVLFVYKVLTTPNDGLYNLRLVGLKPEYKYEIDDNKIISGEQLLNYGLSLPHEFLYHGDYRSIVYRLKAVL